MRSWIPTLAASVALLVLTGCATGRPDTITGLPTDLPANPDPCMEYCREWVPPVYRKVPINNTRTVYYQTVRYVPEQRTRTVSQMVRRMTTETGMPRRPAA